MRNLLLTLCTVAGLFVLLSVSDSSARSIDDVYQDLAIDRGVNLQQVDVYTAGRKPLILKVNEDGLSAAAGSPLTFQAYKVPPGKSEGVRAFERIKPRCRSPGLVNPKILLYLT
jgi:hypothetical protein